MASSYDIVDLIGRNPHFTAPQNATLMALAQTVNNQRGDNASWLSIPKIAAWTGHDQKTVRIALKDLKTCGCLSVNEERKGKSTVFIMMITAIKDHVQPLPETAGVPLPKTVVPNPVPLPNPVGPPLPKTGGVPLPNLVPELLTNIEVEPLSKSVDGDRPKWLEILSRDSRWPKDMNSTVTDIGAAFKGVDLEVEALRAYEWLQTGPGQKRSDLKRFFLNWLAKSKKELVEKDFVPRTPAFDRRSDNLEAFKAAAQEQREKKAEERA